MPHRCPLSTYATLPVILAGALLMVAGMAAAQTYQRPILVENQPAVDPRDPSGEDQPGVMTRDHPDFAPYGMSLGSFTFMPRLNTDIGYSDNIYARDKQAKASAIGILAPEVSLRSNWSRHALEASAHAEAKRYAAAKSENVENYRFTVGGGFDISGDSVITAAVKRERQHDLRGDPDSLTRASEPMPFDLTTGDLAFKHGFGAFTLRLNGDAKKYEYHSSVGQNGRKIDGDDRSFTTLGSTGRLSYEVSPDFAVFGEGGWVGRSYDRASGNGLRSRDSKGPEVGGGVAFTLGALWSGEVAVGYAQRDIEDTNFGSVSAMTARAQILWNLTRATSLRAQALRNIGEAATGPSIAYVSTTYWFGIEHQLQSDLLLGANISTRNLDYARSRDETDVLSVGARATWFINRNFKAQAEYNFSRRDGTVPDTNFDRNIGMLRFVSSF